MTDPEPNLRELALKLAVLEQKMKTAQSEYKTDIANLAAELHKRDKWMIVTIMGTMIGVTGNAVAVLAAILSGKRGKPPRRL